MSNEITDEEIASVLGVVEPELPGMPEVPEPESASAEPGPSEYATALEAVERSLELATHRLSDLRAAREAINDEIRDLKTEVTLLHSMRRVADRPRLKAT